MQPQPEGHADALRRGADRRRAQPGLGAARPYACQSSKFTLAYLAVSVADKSLTHFLSAESRFILRSMMIRALLTAAMPCDPMACALPTHPT